MAFVWPEATLSNAALSALMTQSASPCERDTSSDPLSIPRSQWSVRPSSAMSNLMVALVLPSNGSGPRFDRSSKNAAVASGIAAPFAPTARHLASCWSAARGARQRAGHARSAVVVVSRAPW